MSWSRYSKYIKWYSLFQGLWTEDSIGDIPSDQMLVQSLVGRDMKSVPGASYLAQANNIYAPGVARVLRKRPGFTEINSTAINAAGIWTSFIHLGEIADKFIGTYSVAGSKHSIADFTANPPTEISGGTNFTIGATNLVTPLIFSDGTNPGVIFISRQRDLPQFVNSSLTRSNFTIAGTGLTSLKPAIGEIFTQRALYGDVNVDGTVYDDRVYWTDIRDGNLITDPTTQFLSFETKLKDKVRAIHKISDICMVGKLNNIFTIIPLVDASKPFDIQEEAAGRNKGPVSQQALIEIDQQLFWIGQSNIHSLNTQYEIRDWADAIQPTIRGLNDAYREYSVAGLDTDRSLILFNVYDGSDTTSQDTIALNYKTGALYLWTLKRNVYGFRDVSGEIRLVGGGYIGKAYDELQGTSGDLDDATAVIDADVWTPRYWVNAYGTKQKIPFVVLSVDPVGTESITVQYRLDDATSWTSPSGSPYTVSGTDHKLIIVPIKAVAERIQLRFRNNTADEVYNIKAVGVPALPLAPVYK